MVTLNISLKLIIQPCYVTPVVIMHFTVITYLKKKKSPTYRPWHLNLTYCMICESGFRCLQV